MDDPLIHPHIRFGQVLSNVLGAVDSNQSKLAKHIGIHKSQVSKWCRNYVIPDRTSDGCRMRSGWRWCFRVAQPARRCVRTPQPGKFMSRLRL